MPCAPHTSRAGSVEARQRLLDAPFGGRREQHFRIGMAAAAMAALLQNPAHFPEVVDLAVVGDHEASAGGGHRLAAGRGPIDDRKPAMAEGDARARIDSAVGVIRPPVTKGARHGV